MFILKKKNLNCKYCFDERVIVGACVFCESALNRYQSIPTVDEKDEQDLKKTNKQTKR